MTGQKNKLLVLAAFNPLKKQGAQKLKQSLREYAVSPTLLPKDVHRSLIFASIDGIKWKDYLTDYNIETNQLPRVVLVDFDNNLFFENQTLEDDLALFFTSAVRGDIEPYSNGWTAFPRKLYRSFFRFWPYSLLILITSAVLLAVFVWALCSDLETDEETLSTATIKNKDD